MNVNKIYFSLKHKIGAVGRGLAFATKIVSGTATLGGRCSVNNIFMVHGGFPVLYYSGSARKQEMSSEQKGLCNYNLHIEKTNNHMEKSNESLSGLKVMCWTLMALVTVLMMMVAVWLLARFIGKIFKEKVDAKAKQAALQLVELDKVTTQK